VCCAVGLRATRIETCPNLFEEFEMTHLAEKAYGAECSSWLRLLFMAMQDGASHEDVIGAVLMHISFYVCKYVNRFDFMWLRPVIG